MQAAKTVHEKDELIIENTRLKKELEKAIAENIHFKEELAQLKRLIFGAKSERFVPDVSDEQLKLMLSGDQQIITSPIEVEQIQYTRKKQQSEIKPTGRLPLPEHLERKEIIIEPDEDTSGLKCIGREVSEELEYEPGKLYVNQYIRPKYVRPDNKGILTAGLPSRPIDKGRVGPVLLAHIIISKFTDHQPLYRQSKMFGREGYQIPASTIGDWLKAASNLLEPLYDLHKRIILKQDYLQGDETPIKVQDRSKKGKTHRGYHWVYQAPLINAVLFDYQKGRGREGPKEMLKEFSGWLQTDGYQVYEEIGKNKHIVLLHCMAHARRKFEQALDNDTQRAGYVLSKMKVLYGTERQARNEGLTYEQRQSLRQRESVPILNELGQWLKENYPNVTPKSLIGKAIHYSLSRWNKLSIYITDGKLEIDNNLVENSIRPVALGRKNYLFAGSHEGAKRAAMFYSFLGTCARNNINPQVWLADIFRRIPDQSIQNLEELLPQNWKPLP